MKDRHDQSIKHPRLVKWPLSLKDLRSIRFSEIMNALSLVRPRINSTSSRRLANESAKCSSPISHPISNDFRSFSVNTSNSISRSTVIALFLANYAPVNHAHYDAILVSFGNLDQYGVEIDADKVANLKLLYNFAGIEVKSLLATACFLSVTTNNAALKQFNSVFSKIACPDLRSLRGEANGHIRNRLNLLDDSFKLFCLRVRQIYSKDTDAKRFRDAKSPASLSEAGPIVHRISVLLIFMGSLTIWSVHSPGSRSIALINGLRVQ